MKYAENRNNLVNWLRKQLIGPFTDQDKLIGIPPLDRYPTAVLFPIIRGGEGLDPAMETENDEEEDRAHDISNDSAKLVNSTVRPRRYIPPSSVGFSFFAQGNPVRLGYILSGTIQQSRNT